MTVCTAWNGTETENFDADVFAFQRIQTVPFLDVWVPLWQMPCKLHRIIRWPVMGICVIIREEPAREDGIVDCLRNCLLYCLTKPKRTTKFFRVLLPLWDSNPRFSRKWSMNTRRHRFCYHRNVKSALFKMGQLTTKGETSFMCSGVRELVCLRRENYKP